MPYPEVVDEFETLRLVAGGKSIARFGDGEFNLARGGNCVSQVGSKEIRNELRDVLNTDSKECLIGIPRLDKRGPKNVNWSKLAPIYEGFLKPHKPYYSAFITRPDSAPWIATDEYFDQVESLWRDKEVTMVYGSNRSLSSNFGPMACARSLAVIQAPYRDAYAAIDELASQITAVGRKTVLLMVGPTATCLALRLSKTGFHALDLGHIGMFWRAHHNPKLQRLLRIDE